MDGDTHTIIRSTSQERLVRDWELVLIAVGIPCAVERRGREWDLVVDPADAARAHAELAGYDEDRRAGASPAPAIPEYGSTWTGLGFAILLVAFARLTGPRGGATALFRAGEADAAAIVGGEWWRAVTALTLHADALHLVANVAIGAVVTTIVCWSIGPGVGAWMLLLSGAAGNWLTALTYSTGHRSVGASTAVFGGIGVLVGLAIVRGRRRGWIPLAAGLALLGLLGTSERADLRAHLFGFVAGIAAGLPIAPLPSVRSRPIQWLLALGAVAAIVG
ncbi:MAG: rhomboid family intramembrane serine protease, partial [Candidatus Binatia bacterium]